MAFPVHKLVDCCELITDGDHQPPPKSESGVPFITISDIDEFNTISYDKVAYAPLSYYDSLKEDRKAKKGDVLYSVVGSYGKPVLVKQTVPIVFQRHIALLRPNDAVLPAYLFYSMLNRDFYNCADAVAIGAAQKTITLNALRNMQIPLPSFETQKRIVQILEPYDSLIENNRRQIKLLEEAAQRLYKEWFVDLRFPGHEHTPIVNGIPQGWRKCLLPDFAEILYGYPFNGKLFNSNGKGKPIVRIRNVPSGVSDDYTTEQAPDAYVVKNGDVLVGMDGEFHMNTWSGGDAYLVQRTCCIRPVNEIAKGYLLQALYAPIKFFEKTLVGATVAHLGKKHLDSIELLLPDRDSLLLPFMELTKQRQTLLSENVILTEARDRLLPKLMSGEVEV